MQLNKAQSARLDRKKLFGDPVMVSTIVVLLIFLSLFILYPLVILLIDSVAADGHVTLDVFKRVLDMGTFRTACGWALLWDLVPRCWACCLPMWTCM